MCKRAALCGINGLRVAAVSTASHTAASISALTWEELSAYSKVISKDHRYTYSNAIRAVTFSDGQVFGVGDYLSISINGVSYQIDILGFHHDPVTDAASYGGDYAGITWQMHDCYATKYGMNSSYTNAGGWNGCLMRTSTMQLLLGYLTSDLSGVIVPVDKLAGAGSGSSTIITSSDNLFLLSEVEILGSLTYSSAGEGSRYAYYVAGNSMIKKLGGTATRWWTRSPPEGNTIKFVNITQYGDPSSIDAPYEWGVAFAFCT